MVSVSASRLTLAERVIGGALTAVWLYGFYAHPFIDLRAWMEYDLQWWPGIPEAGLFRRCALILIITPLLVVSTYGVLYHFEFAWAERYRVEGWTAVGWNDPNGERRAEYLALNKAAFVQLLKSQPDVLPVIGAICAYSHYRGGLSPEIYQSLLQTPDAATMAWQLGWSLLFFETWFYWGHRMQHRWFYAYHKRHHEYRHPNVLTSTWGTPFDGLVTAIMPGMIPIFFFHMHYWTIVLWVIIHRCHTFVDHGGYEFPFNPFQLIPFSNHVRAHDFHHTKNVCNFGLYWRFWDQLLGTDKQWNEYERKRHLRFTNGDLASLQVSPIASPDAADAADAADANGNGNDNGDGNGHANGNGHQTGLKSD